ncbi:MAG: general secretion pathway protein GspK, partial [Planctomycetales bacterium]|nr:general secretion pathway protein GspK [Planctomycetales bacterium]
LQARMCAESGAQTVRLLLAYPRNERLAMGGTWDNPAMFQALNVIPDSDPARRGNFSIVAPSLDEFGNYTGLRYGLQNESAKLNLNTLSQLDALASSGTLGAAAGGGGGGDPAAQALTALASEATAGMSSGMAQGMLLALPGMTPEVADAILDWLDADEEPREFGAEFGDYYQQLQPAYKPANGPIHSIEQLLLVRGVTPQLLFGYDENRNGLLDTAELSKMNSGMQPGALPGSLPTLNSDPDVAPPPPLGWAPYLTLQSQEKNVASDGSPRININGDDLQLLYEDLSAALGNEDWASFIVAYRFSGTAGGSGASPLATLASMAAADSEQTDGALGVQLESLAAASGPQTGGGSTPPQPWSANALSSFDLTQTGGTKFQQVLDVIDATITVNGPAGAVTYSSPFSSLPIDLATSTPLLMDYLTTVDAEAVPGRINIMECPQEILRGIPGLSDEVVDQIVEARVDGSESETRNFETWLAVEGLISMDEMRAILPLVTCGGDVYKAQIIGYLEGNAAFSRIEAVVSGVGEIPQILFFRRMDHLGRGFDIPTLGQRFDAGLQAGMLQ